MKFNFTLDYVYINADWFSDKNSLFGKIGEKAFFLYLTLFKFRLHKQDKYHVFLTSIGLLRKETGYKTSEVLELLLKLRRYRVINFEGYSRTEYFYDEKGNIKDKDVIIMFSEDAEWEYNIPVDLRMIQHYLDLGLKERYIGLYCLLRKLSNNIERKAYMSIEKMASILKIDKDIVNSMVYELNKRYLLYSWKVKVKKSNGEKSVKERFEHVLCYKYEMIDQFVDEFKDEIDKNLSKLK